jgi:hypothetical protein
MSGYNMEGTKKQGISVKKKEAILKELKASAKAESQPPPTQASSKPAAKGK